MFGSRRMARRTGRSHRTTSLPPPPITRRIGPPDSLKIVNGKPSTASSAWLDCPRPARGRSAQPAQERVAVCAALRTRPGHRPRRPRPGARSPG